MKLKLISLFSMAVLAICSARATNRALLIGIDQYKDSDGVNRLSGAENDVDGLASALQEAAGFDKSDIRILKGPDASKIGIVRALEDLQSKSKPGDIVFFSFSGHGFQPDDKVFLIPYDALGGSDAVIQNSSLEAAEVSRLLGKVDADVLVASFDMCRNDPRFGAGRDQSINTMSYAMDRDLKIVRSADGQGPRRIVRMFASSRGQRSWEMPGMKRGYFSYYLEKGLRGEASPDGVVKVSSLIEYLEQEVITSVSKDRGVEQRPDIKPEGSQLLAFVLAKPTNAKKREQSEFDSLLKHALAVIGGRPLREIPESEVKTAEELLNQADKLNSQSVEVKYQLGRCAQKFGRINEAETFFNAAIALDPKNVNTLKELGGLFEYQIQDYKTAEKMYRRAIQLEPTSATLYINIGDILRLYQENFGDAEKMYRKAIDLDPHSSVFYNRLGMVLDDQDKIDNAEMMYRKAISLDPQDVYPYLNCHNLLMLNGRLEDARKIREQAATQGITIDP